MRALGEIFEVRALTIIHMVMAVVLCLTWAVLFVLTVIAFYRGLILCSDEEDVLKDSSRTVGETFLSIRVDGPKEGEDSANKTLVASPVA